MTKKEKDEAAAQEVLADLKGEEGVDYEAAGLDGDFAKAVANRQKLYAKKKEVEAAIADLTDEIQVLVETTGHKTLNVDEWRVTLAEGRKGAKRIDPQLLMKKAKLSAAMIAACTVEGKPGAAYILVTPKKEGQ